MKSKIELHNQKEIDEEILNFVRGMLSIAPITAESTYKYLKGTERRKVTQLQVEDRLKYLVSAGYLMRKTEWEGGEVVSYEIMALGMDLLDGNIPPRNWNK